MDITFSKEETNSWFNDLQDIALKIGNNPLGKDEIELASETAKKYIRDINNIQNEIAHGKGYVLFRGCPIDSKKSSTTINSDDVTKETLISALTLLVYCNK